MYQYFSLITRLHQISLDEIVQFAIPNGLARLTFRGLCARPSPVCRGAARMSGFASPFEELLASLKFRPQRYKKDVCQKTYFSAKMRKQFAV